MNSLGSIDDFSYKGYITTFDVLLQQTIQQSNFSSKIHSMSHIIATFAPHKQKHNTKCPNSNISERKRSLRHTLFTTQ